MTGFALRAQTGRGPAQLVTDFSPEHTLGQLRARLATLAELPESRLGLLSGFPPRPLDLSRPELTLAVAGVKSGDSIIVRELSTPAKEADEPRVSTAPAAMTDHDSATSPAPTVASGGILLKQVVPSDNSCLFTSIAYVLGGKEESEPAAFMREIIAEAVRSDPQSYSEAVLGKSPADYCAWIRTSEAWGGAIELAILSAFYGLEIAVVNSLHGIVNRFGEDQRFAMRSFLMYDGIHYDPLYLEPFDGGKRVTLFPSSDTAVLDQAIELAREAKQSRQFTDVTGFTLRCIKCDAKLAGQTQASQHAAATGHDAFAEISQTS